MVKDIQHVALLARLALTPEESAVLGGQLSNILAYVEQLQRVPTDGVEPTAHALPLSNVMRSDERKPSLPPEQALANAPARHGQLFKVPKIIE